MDDVTVSHFYRCGTTLSLNLYIVSFGSMKVFVSGGSRICRKGGAWGFGGLAPKICFVNFSNLGDFFKYFCENRGGGPWIRHCLYVKRRLGLLILWPGDNFSFTYVDSPEYLKICEERCYHLPQHCPAATYYEGLFLSYVYCYNRVCRHARPGVLVRLQLILIYVGYYFGNDRFTSDLNNALT